MHRNTIVASDHSKSPDDERTVVPFRPRSAGPIEARGWRWSHRASEPTPPLVDGLARYEGGELEDSYRHRMLVNLAAFVFTIALACAGVWLAIQIGDLRQKQDCFLSGRRNCAPIDVKTLTH